MENDVYSTARRAMAVTILLTGSLMTSGWAQGYRPELTKLIGGIDGTAFFGVARSGDSVFVVGVSRASDFPVKNAIQPTYAGDSDPNGAGDIVVARIDAASGGVLWATFLGGAETDFGNGIVLENDGNIVISGWTRSTDFPTTEGALQTQPGGASDGIIARFSPDGQLLYSTRYGGTGDDQFSGIALWGAGFGFDNSLTLTGFSNSPDFPVENASDSSCGCSSGRTDVILVRLNPDFSRQWATFLGTSGSEVGLALQVTPLGDTYVTGWTDSSAFPKQNFATFMGGRDAFATRFDANGVRRQSAIIGGEGDDMGTGIFAVDRENVFIAGTTTSTNLTIRSNGQLQASFGGGASDGFFARFDDLGFLGQSGYFGGPGNDEIRYLLFESRSSDFIQPERLHFGGVTSGDLPGVNGLQASYGGGESDGFFGTLKVSQQFSGARVAEPEYLSYLGGTDRDAATSAFLSDPSSDQTEINIGGASSSDLATTPFTLHSAGKRKDKGLVKKVRRAATTTTPLPDLEVSFEERSPLVAGREETIILQVRNKETAQRSANFPNLDLLIDRAEIVSVFLDQGAAGRIPVPKATNGLYSLNTVPVGAVLRLEVTVRASQDALAASPPSMVLDAFAAEGFPGPLADADSTDNQKRSSFSVLGNPDLSVTITPVQASAPVGSTAAFEIVVENLSQIFQSPSPNLRIFATRLDAPTLMDGTTAVELNPLSMPEAYVAFLAPLPPGARRVYRFSGIARSTPSVYVSVEIQSATDTNSENDSSNTELPVTDLPDVRLTLESSPTAVRYLGSWTDRFVITNASDVAASNIRLRLSRQSVPEQPASTVKVALVNADGDDILEECLLEATGADCFLGDLPPHSSRVIEVIGAFVNLPSNENDYPSVLGFRLEAVLELDADAGNNVAISDHVTQIPAFQVASAAVTPTRAGTGDQVKFDYEVLQLRTIVGSTNELDFFPKGFGSVRISVDGLDPELFQPKLAGAAGAVRLPSPGVGGKVVVSVEGTATSAPEAALELGFAGEEPSPYPTNNVGYVSVPVDVLKLWDFGDDPFPLNTLWFWIADGARHELVAGGPILGAAVDADPNGQPSLKSDGDDKDIRGDDEDGVKLADFLVAAAESKIQVTVNKACQLDCWIDFNGDGIFDHRPPAPSSIANEYVNDAIVGHPGGSYPLKPGLNEFYFRVPNNIMVFGSASARFRVSTAGGLKPNGNAPDGEVEDYQALLFEFYPDFGDAPDAPDVPGYPTLSQNDGAVHFLTEANFYLGHHLDFESEAKPDADALGDDRHNGLEVVQTEEPDDEDGVQFLTPLSPGLSADLEIFLTSAETKGAKLDAWIDFNSDLDWNDLGEQVLTNRDLVPGTNIVTIAIPAEASLGKTFARFRLSRNGNLKPFGPATSGEVEDYAVQIEPAGPRLVGRLRTSSQGGAEIELEFQPGDILETASEATGPWSEIKGVASPARFPTIDQRAFFRLQRR